jgi:putative PIG3 family NAD(P)H quinone oxidoreductase
MRTEPGPLGPNDVAIEVHATAVNRADLLQRAGAYAPPPGVTNVLGLECAGVVVDRGSDLTHLAVGERVCALLAGGGYAPWVVAPAAQVWPSGALDFAIAAALPEALCTGWMVLFDVARLLPGERVLLHAGASGIGTTAIQILRAFGHSVFVTAGSREKVDRCVALGAEGGAIRTAGPWVEAVLAWAPRGVDVIVDPVGGPYLEADQQVLAVGGRLVVIGLLGGRSAPLDLGRLLVKRQSVHGTVLRSRSDEDKARIVAGMRATLWPLVERGEVRPVIDRVLSIGDVERAHAALASDETVGKIVLLVR